MRSLVLLGFAACVPAPEFNGVTSDALVDAPLADVIRDWGTPMIVDTLQFGVREDTITISSDGLEAYFLGRHDADVVNGVYKATRTSVAAAWSTPTIVPSLSDASRELLKVVLAPSGLEMFLAISPSTTQLDFDVYRATRASLSQPWSLPIIVPQLSRAAYWDVPGSVTANGSVIYLVRQEIDGDFNIYTSARSSTFAEPVLVPDLDTTKLEEHPWVNNEETVMYFSSDRDEQNRDIFVSTRESAAQPWGAPAKLDLGNLGLEYSPWLVEPSMLYLTISVGGVSHIYMATK